MTILDFCLSVAKQHRSRPRPVLIGIAGPFEDNSNAEMDHAVAPKVRERNQEVEKDQ